MNTKTDWLAWILHGIFGAVVGALFGFVAITRRRYGIWLSTDLIAPYLAGVTLIGIGIGSLHGDKLWMGDNYRLFPPDSPETTMVSKGISIAMTGIGTIIAIGCIIKHFNWM